MKLPEHFLRKIIKIKPEFQWETTGYVRIVITPTQFNNKPFNYFITDKDAKIFKMDNLDNLHGTTFYRSDEDVLFVTYILKQNQNTSIQEIYESIYQIFWFNKPGN